jgi:hypothetical protein
MGGKQASEEYKCELIFNGSIDRVDRRIVSEKDDEGTEIEVEHFRIIDYKSVKQGGGKKLKEKCRYIKHTKAGREDILPHQIQHHIYAMALKSKYPDAVIDEVIYECLLDDETPHLHFPDDMSVGVADAETKKGYYKEMHDNIAELPAAVRDRIAEPLVDGIFSTRNTDKDKVCVYCRYADMCPKMLGEKN